MITLKHGDCLAVLKELPAASVQMCVTSPPFYGLRSYLPAGHADKGLEIGLESSVDAYVARLVEVFREVRRCLKPDGVIFVNLGDSYATSGQRQTGRNDADFNERTQERYGKYSKAHGYAADQPRIKINVDHGLKPKDLIGVPWRCAFALQADGYYLRQDLIWQKPNAMPESVKDRCTRSHEYIFLLSKSPKYYFNHEAIKEPGVGRETYFGSDRYSSGSGRNDSGSYNSTTCMTRNRRSVWSVATQPFSAAKLGLAVDHFAVFPPKLIEPCILAGSRPGDVVLDPFGGSGTTALVARDHGRRALLIELNPDYIEITKRRLGLEQATGAALRPGCSKVAVTFSAVNSGAW